MNTSTFGLWFLASVSSAVDTLPGTNPLTMEGDLAAQMVTSLDEFVAQAVEDSVESRQQLWNRDYRSHEDYTASIAPNRERFRGYIGCVDERMPIDALHYVATTAQTAEIAKAEDYTVYAVQWHVFDGVHGEGLLLEPEGDPVAQIIALPDADWTPEMLAGLSDEIPQEAQFARRLAEQGCRVVVPTLIDRDDTWSGNPKIGRMTNQTHREFIYRMAFELGRHIIGYEVQKVLALVDWMSCAENHPPIGAIGYGEGGLLAFYSAAVDTRIDAAVVSGYFQAREEVWQEPIYRNVWALLHEFGDAEIASLIAPRTLIVEASHGVEVEGPPPVRDGRAGAAPGRLVSPPLASVKAEFDRAHASYEQLGVGQNLSLVEPDNGGDSPGSDAALTGFLNALGQDQPLALSGTPPQDKRTGFSPEARQHRQFHQLIAFTQDALRQAASRRETLWSKADRSSIEQWQDTCQYYRDYLWDEVIGRCPSPSIPTNPRTRLAYDEPGFKGYEVVLDVWEETFAYGILLVPKGIEPDERRPVVVCQHGLEGRSQEVVDSKIESPYNAYGAELADQGFVVYAPQNAYIGQDAFRVIQRKANPVKWSLFSLITHQHERTLEWLGGQPFVDAERIGFYGLSYGGKTAMRVPALLDGYALSICSADFNEWIVKNATYDSHYSYMFSGEYEMPEFNLGNTFNYAEMAWLIAPRPFMVERGHHDGVAPDEWVAYEYAIVRHLYANLSISDRTEIEFFNSGHEINGEGTFQFLHRHLTEDGSS
jgi:dienelactone hydrolase